MAPDLVHLLRKYLQPTATGWQRNMGRDRVKYSAFSQKAVPDIREHQVAT